MEQNQERKFVCKFCNKKYPCGKSLGGHIRIHMSNAAANYAAADAEERAAAEISINKLLIPSSNARRRSKRLIKYKEIGFYSNNKNCYNSLSLENGSSSVSEREQEQEEVAMCLMMLSRDSGCKKGLTDSLADSSDNNSVILEAKSSSIDVRITVKNDMKCGDGGGGEFLKVKKKQRDSNLKSAESGHSSGNSDSGYFRNGPKKVDSEVSFNGFLENAEAKKKFKVESGSGFEEFGAKFGKSLSSKFKCVKTEFLKDDLVSEVGDNRANHRDLTKYGLRRSAKYDYYSPDYLCNTFPKGSKYECLTCNRTFDSHRALGGHRASHTKVNDCTESSIHETNEDTLADDSFSVPMTDNTKVTKSSHGKSPSTHRRGSSGNAEKKLGAKRNKGHECPFCFRVFKSGQALGGHKRSHFVGGSEDRTLVIKQDSPDQMPALIDLNLPAPVEEDAMANAGFMPW